MKKLFIICVLFLSLFWAAQGALAQDNIVYGVELANTTTPRIFTVNQTTGAATVAGSILHTSAAAAQHPTSKLVFYSQYTDGGAATPGFVYTWNPATGANVQLATRPNTQFIRMAFDTAGTLYAMNQNNQLYTINTGTGAATLLGTVTGPASLVTNGGGDIAFSPTGTMFMTVNSNLYTVNIGTRVATAIGTGTGISTAPTGLAYGNSGNMYSTVLNTTNSPIYQVSPTTAAAILMPSSTGFPIGDLASIPRYADLQMTKTASANFAVGQNSTYTLSVRNNGPQAPIANATNPITVTDVLPTGLNYVSATGTGWTCSYASATRTVTCTSTTAPASGATMNAITVTVGVTSAAVPSVSNTATVSSATFDQNTANNSSTVVSTISVPSLRVAKTSNGAWTVGQAGAQYSLTATNIGGGATTGTITILDTMPAGITPNWTGTRTVTSSGVTWNCTFSGQNVTCTTANAMAASGTSTITLPVNVTAAANTGAGAVNYASIGGGGDTFNSGTAPTPGAGCTDANHCASNTTTITNQVPVANNVTSATLQSTAGSTGISSLSGTDPDGNVASFRIESLPSAASGVLYLCAPVCTAVTVGQVIPFSSAANLQFDPANGFIGSATFTFTAIDNLGAVDATPATYTIPIRYNLSCSNVYASAFSGGRTILYELNGATMTAVYTAPQTVGGLAISSNGSAYYDNGTFANPPLYRFDGAAQTNTGMTLPNLLVGEAADAAGNVYYINASYHLIRANATGTVQDLGAITFDAGDTIGPALQYGDMTFDGNGRLYWYSSVGGSGVSYLYVVDPTTLRAKNAGDIGPNGATGAAFDASGRLITTTNSGATVFAINLGSANLDGVAIGTASPTVYDLGSCAAPLFNPALSALKTVTNITRNQTPATVAEIGDVLEFTITVTNNGNFPTTDATLADLIPNGTTYQPNSTTLNGAAFADAAGAMPFAAAREINSTGQPAGVVKAGGSTAIVKFRVTVNNNSLPAQITNTAAITFPTMDGGITTTQTINSNQTSTPTQLPPPSVGLVKSCTVTIDSTVSDCGTAPRLAGTDLNYKIEFTNTGGQPAAGLIILDAIPLNTDYKIGSATAGAGTTGLVFTIEYSNNYDPGNPGAAVWTGGSGTPGTYDPLVKAIRWRVTSGTLPISAPNNTGNVSFTVKIR